MKRYHLTTAAALVGLGLLGGCASMNSSACGEPRQGFLSRLFGGLHRGGCECVETGRVVEGEGPAIPEPGCCEAPGVGAPSFLTTPPTYTAPPGLPMPAPLAQPVPANPSSQVKDVGK